MKQREVQDANNMRWTCVEALSGVGDASDASAEAAADKLENGDGTVPVACTPSGGASSLRIRMPRGWEESASDEELLAAIAAAEHS
ncbi:hypothetical protein [Azohydromonas caseinilytica]|uniref:Uncharacterized protein n=1 Tax=Azohydromonas caseinilytica TaxID=2728836 RepID=A0A848F2G0_9BURK|nr:hypothetical protein [Azohydromonas caseinilytica]NML13592.1 hypothetical protein [Azohydromonas caseinilytica]